MDRVRKLIDLPGKMQYDGSGVGIAVLDSGIGYHPDLEGKVASFRDFTMNRKAQYDDYGHGTHVCGILCGSGELWHGRYRGIAPGGELIVGKILDRKGKGNIDDLLKALDWIAEVRKAFNIRILNLSVGLGDDKKKDEQMQVEKKLKTLWQEGILIICAAGNKGPDDNSISSVGGNSNVVTVGCYDGDIYETLEERCSIHSGRGRDNAKVCKPDLVAPGTNIISCSNHCTRTRNGWKSPYAAKSGTSMSTPLVAGAAAILIQKDRDITNKECKEKLQYTSKDLGLPWNQQGWGMLNVRRFLDD